MLINWLVLKGLMYNFKIVQSNNNNNNSLFDPIMKNTIRNTILENKLRYGHPKKPSGLV